jgi:uncharacterized membrane protein
MCLRDRDHRQGPQRGSRIGRRTAVAVLDPDRIHHLVASLTQGEGQLLIMRIGGVLMIIVGVLLVTGTWNTLTELCDSGHRGQRLSEDPHDFVATHLLHTANGLTGQGYCSALST